MPRTAHAAKVRKSTSCAPRQRPPEEAVAALAAVLQCSTEEAAARAVRFMAAYLRVDELT